MNRKAAWMGALIAVSALGLVALGSPRALAGVGTEFVPIGASYQDDTLAYFSLQAFERDTDQIVTIRVLPITYATNAFNITPGERADNLALAQDRADQIDDACEAIATGPATCEAQVIDIQVRDDAETPALVDQLGPATDGVFILGGDQTIAMQVAANTLLEAALEARVLDGVPLGGTSAGAAVQSRFMIAGYTGNHFAWHALELGAVDLWYGPPGDDERGLLFGLDSAVIEQHVLERGRIARLLQAAEQLPGAHIGIGVDWGTGVRIEAGNLVTGTVGAYTAVVIDQETYAAAGGAVYFGPDQILSIRDVALHLLPPGGYGYDLAGREPVFEGTAFPAPNIAGRDRGLFAAPPGAGSLYLAGDLSSDPIGAVAGDFASEAAAAGGTTLVFAAGYPSDSTANQAMNNWINRLSQLGVPDVDGVALTGGADPDEIAAELADAGAIFMIGGRGDVLANQVQMLIDTGIDQILLERWQNGAPVLLDNAAAAAAGAWMSASPPPADVEIEASDSFLAGHVPIAPGLGLLPGVVFEPRFLYDYLYGRLVSHLAAHPDMVGFGIERATAVRINPDGVWVLGDMAVMVMDGRFTAHIGSGTNDAFAAVWILLDTFATGQEIPTPAPDIPFAIYLPIAIRTEN
jgi:cyanophycinase